MQFEVRKSDWESKVERLCVEYQDFLFFLSISSKRPVMVVQWFWRRALSRHGSSYYWENQST